MCEYLDWKASSRRALKLCNFPIDTRDTSMNANILGLVNTYWTCIAPCPDLCRELSLRPNVSSSFSYSRFHGPSVVAFHTLQI